MMWYLVSDVIRTRHMIWLTAGELTLVNLIRNDKGIGNVLVHKRNDVNQ